MKIPVHLVCLLLTISPLARSIGGENLLANPSGQSGATAGWSIIASGGDGWETRTQSVDGDGSSFITSYNWCTRSQTIDLLAAGYSESFLDRSPPILAQEWFRGFQNVADFYFLRVELRDATGAVRFTVPAAMFAAGTNTLAAEVHQASPSSSDLTFDLALSGAIDASGERYFDIVNGNELRASATFASTSFPVGSAVGLVVRSTDAGGESIVRSLAVTVISDDPDDPDADGLTDARELQFFATIAGQDGADDGDHDNQSNWQEWVYGTSPTDPGSRQSLVIQRAVPGQHSIGWSSVTTRRYRLPTTASLPNGPWVETAGGARMGTGGPMSETLPDSPSGQCQFRLLVEIP